MAYVPEKFTDSMRKASFDAVAGSGLTAEFVKSWDADLLRESRICVPIDVQALVVSEDVREQTAGVRLAGPLSPGSLVPADAADDVRAAAIAGPEPFSAPAPREVGVHLHWALPDALLTARLHDSGDGTVQAADRVAAQAAPTPATAPRADGGALGLPALPDRWLVQRVVLPATGDMGVATGWIVDALTGRSWTLAQFHGDTTGFDAQTAVVPASGLTGTAGGTATWTAGYDAAGGRFTFHDPLTDLRDDPELGGRLPGGPVDSRATYVVIGWWSDPDLDPLDDVRSNASLDARLKDLGWYRVAPPEPEKGQSVVVPNFSESFGAAHLPLLETPVTMRSVVLPSVIPAAKVAPLVAGTPTFASRRALAAERLAAAPAALPFAAVQDALRLRAEYGAFVAVAPKKPPRPEASTLLHGAVLGVPLLGDTLGETLRAADPRPDPSAAEVALGETLFDAIGAMTAGGVAGDQPLEAAERDTLERVMTAFLQRSLHRLAEEGGAAAIDEAMHSAGFASVATGEPGITDTLRDGKASIPDRGRRIGKAPRAGASVGVEMIETLNIEMAFAKSRTAAGLLIERGSAAYTQASTSPPSPPPPPTGATRTEVRPAPELFVPTDPVVVLRGAGRSLRHGGDGRWSRDGRLYVRHASQIDAGMSGVLRGEQMLPPVASGAVPAEATRITREAILLSPHADGWKSRRASELAGGGAGRTDARIRARVEAETLLRFDVEGRYSTVRAATSGSPSAVVTHIAVEGAAGLAMTHRAGFLPSFDDERTALAAEAQSVAEGVPISEVGITAWSQPWSPVWLEFETEVTSRAVTDRLDDWTLGRTDLRTPDDAVVSAAPVVSTVLSRVPLSSGAAAAVGGAIAQYIADENQRDLAQGGVISEETEVDLGELGDVASAPDLLGASLDGIRRRLRGLPARALKMRAADGSVTKETPDASATFLTAGTARVTRLRVVDAFGRVLDLDPSTAVVPQRLTVAGAPGTLLRPPRFTLPARVRVRLVSSAATAPFSSEDARVDETTLGAGISPVVGFLLPDHVDESLELFTAAGEPVGELLVEATSGASGGGVVWEPAPGRPLPHDASPNAGLAPEHAVLGAFASGMVRADAAARGGHRAVPGEDSALSALIRAIDATLAWTDAVAGSGSSQVAAIVGRPLAVVRAVVSVDIASDIDELALDAEARAARAAAIAELATVGVAVRLGELSRPDDGLMAWFADDDYSRAHLVDAVVADLARPIGPGRGFLTEWGLPPEDWAPRSTPIDHPYLRSDSELIVHPGAPRIVTLLMTPGAAVSFTSGIVPRGRVQLQRSWFADALDKLIPSVRVGPVLVDPGQVRLPLVAALGEHQRLTTREGPTGWRDDAILAATSSAVLPDRAQVLREGWIRVAPPSPPNTPGT